MKLGTASKVALNTVVLYARILISIAINLVSVPLVLKALGASDYGLYNLVAGVVAMLSFLNNSMTVSSQRYMSVAMGTNDKYRVNLVYNTSFWLHIVLGLAIVLILECCVPLIGKLNIDPSRIGVAQIIFQFLILSTFAHILAVPFDAIINAHEDMVVFSIIGVISDVLMLLLAVSLHYILTDRLVLYGIGVACIAILSFLLKYAWSLFAYKDYHICLKKYWHQLQTKEMLGFTGWNLFGGLAMMGRNQGVAVVINMFLGTVVNAAYGIANQINGALAHFSSTFQKAINPQLMKSEGMNDRNRLLRISYISSKFSVLALCLFAVPLIIEMDDVLAIWLRGDVPSYTKQLSVFILLLSIVTQFSVGIMSAIQAVGKISDYQITMGLIILLNIPISYIVLKAGLPVYYTTVFFVFLELISLGIRLAFANKLVNMPMSQFFINVVKPVLIVVFISTIISIVPHYFISGIWLRLILTSSTYAIIYFYLAWLFALNQPQRESIKSKVHEIL